MILFVIKPLLRTTIFIRPANKVTNLFVFLKTNYSLLGWRYSRDATTLPLKNSGGELVLHMGRQVMALEWLNLCKIRVRAASLFRYVPLVRLGFG